MNLSTNNNAQVKIGDCLAFSGYSVIAADTDPNNTTPSFDALEIQDPPKVTSNLIFTFYDYSIGETTHHSLKVFGLSIWSLLYNNRLGWFRIFGKGIKFKDTRINRLMFSERNGYSMAVTINKWRIAILG